MRDVLRKYKFEVQFAGVTVAGFTRVSGLGRGQDTIEYRAGEDVGNFMTKLPGLLKYGTVTFERGMASEADFIAWAQVTGDTTAVFKKDVTINVKDKTGAVMKTYVLKDAWPSSVEIDDLDSSSSGVMFERMTVEFNTYDIYETNSASVVHNL